MARRKKNDFWDDVDEEVRASAENQSGKGKVEEDWSATKSTPVKVIMRFLLMIACIVALGSAYIAYQYVGDRYAGGSYSSDYYDSKSFASEYNKSVDQLLQLVAKMEADPSVTEEGNEELLATQIENYMGKDTNFAFLIQDGEHYLLASSGEDAKERIEASNHYALISITNGEVSVKSTIASQLLDKNSWEEALSQTSHDYVIYSAVDNELTQNDAYSKSLKTFSMIEEYFNYAKFTGIVSAILFIIFLVFCIIATGMKRGYEDVCLTWFDKVFTEIALAIMVAGAGALCYGEYWLTKQNGDVYKYASIAGIFVIYIWVAHSYFSIVRRIKAGRLLRYSLIGCIIAAIGNGIGKLPKPLNYIVGAIVIIAINAAAVYGIVHQKDLYSVKGIPVTYIAAGVVFVIELLSLIVSRGRNEYEVLDEPKDKKNEKEAEKNDISAIAQDLAKEKTSDTAVMEAVTIEAPEAEDVSEFAPELDAPQEWETMDLSSSIAEAEKKNSGIAQEMSAPEVKTAAFTGEANETVLLPEEEMEKALRAAGLATAAEETVVIPTIGPSETQVAMEPVAEEITEEEPAEEKVNFVQLNKDIRKKFKASLKKQGMIITVRAPEKPVLVDMDSEELTSIVTDIFSQVEKFAKPETKTYAEVHQQGNKVVYIVKITVSDEAKAMAEEAAAGTAYFTTAKEINEAHGNKFIVSFEKDVLKIGMMMNAAE